MQGIFSGTWFCGQAEWSLFFLDVKQAAGGDRGLETLPGVVELSCRTNADRRGGQRTDEGELFLAGAVVAEPEFRIFVSGIADRQFTGIAAETAQENFAAAGWEYFFIRTEDDDRAVDASDGVLQAAAERGEAHLGIDPRGKKTAPSAPQSD